MGGHSDNRARCHPPTLPSPASGEGRVGAGTSPAMAAASLPTTNIWLRSRRSSLRNLHVDPVRILDVQTRIVALQRRRTALCQIVRRGFPAETGYSDREVIHNAGRASVVERDQHLGVAEANDSARLVLADHGEAEHLLIEIDGTLHVRDVNADVVDIRAFEIDVFLCGRGCCAGSQHCKTGNQFSTAERALLEASYEIRNDRFHGTSFPPKMAGQQDYKRIIWPVFPAIARTEERPRHFGRTVARQIVVAATALMHKSSGCSE